MAFVFRTADAGPDFVTASRERMATAGAVSLVLEAHIRDLVGRRPCSVPCAGPRSASKCVIVLVVSFVVTIVCEYAAARRTTSPKRRRSPFCEC